MKMKTIKNIQQIKDEKRRLKQRREDLERRIRNSWQELKWELKPANIAGDTLGSFAGPSAAPSQEGGGLLRDTLNYGLGLLTRKLVEKTGDRLESLLKKRK
jgi:hypothetical protein